MEKNCTLIIDFDSTFVSVETLEELAKIALQHSPEKYNILAELRNITKLGMEGTIPYHESLSRRFSLFQLTQEHIAAFTHKLQQWITPSIQRNKEFFKTNAESIYIISGGFTEYICPVVAPFGIHKNHVLANSFAYNAEGIVTGYDTVNPLSRAGGKVTKTAELQLPGTVIVIGDGFTDYEIKQGGKAQVFYAFTEHVRRDTVVQLADAELSSFDVFLELYHFTG